MLEFFQGGEAAEAGTVLADSFVRASTTKNSDARARSRAWQKALGRFPGQVEQGTRGLKLNFIQRAKLANTFKWRLREQGVASDVIDELTRVLLLRISGPASVAKKSDEPRKPRKKEAVASVPELLASADARLARGEVERAIESYREVLRTDPHHAVAHNNLGAALCRLGQYPEAEAEFRRAIHDKPSYLDAYANLGTTLRCLGRYADAEAPLRRVVKTRPRSAQALASLGSSLAQRGKLAEAREFLLRASAMEPSAVEALVALGQIEAIEGRLEQAEATFKRALSIDPACCGAWAGLVGVRRMTAADTDWLLGAKRAVAAATSVVDRVAIHFALGKYHDDLGDYDRAFRSYSQANSLQKAFAAPYDRAGHARAVDQALAQYDRGRLAAKGLGASESTLPVFVVGMPRSGTSLVEQIIASHPKAAGAGEMAFWSDAAVKLSDDGDLILDAFTREKLAADYLELLSAAPARAGRVVDKTTINALHLGLILDVFPRARIVHVRRDPLDTCLSAYFQAFPPELDFTMDLADLAYYYRQRERLMAHWRAVVPAGTMLEVPYEELVADQEGWTRRIMTFLGLEWHDQTLQFHTTSRTVLTASYWQVRQRMYQSSVGRWRHYRKHLGPLMRLREPLNGR